MRAAGRGITVLSGCSDVGVVIAALAAGAAFPDEPVDVLLGGLCLAGAAMEQQIRATARDPLDGIRPALFAPGLCSGCRLTAALAAAAPERCVPSVVGARYDLCAP